MENNNELINTNLKPNKEQVEEWASATLEKIINGAKTNSGENVVEEESDLNHLQVTQELIENSVGKRKCVKKVVVAFISGALVALLATYGITIHNNDKKIDNYRENYVTMERYLKNTEETKFYDLEGIGKSIASSILLKSNEENFDITYELVVGLGLACEEVNDLHPVGSYNLNRAFDHEEFRVEFDGWMETVYGSMRDTLEEGGLIELPKTLRDLLIKFGFDKGVYKCNPITGILEFSEKENVSDKEMLKSFIEYASSIGITNGNSKGGR